MNKKIKKIISAALWGAMLSTPTLQAGIGIGTSSPHASAALDITATDRGLLPPRLALTGTTDTTTITSPAEGLIVYNTATISDVTPGIYLWDGVKWTALKAESDTTETVTPADPTTGVVVGLCPAANGLPITTVDSSTEFGGAQTYIPNTVLDGTPKLILLTGTGGSEAALFADNITMSGSGNITRRWDLPAPSAHTGEYYFVAPFPYSNITFPANFQRHFYSYVYAEDGFVGTTGDIDTIRLDIPYHQWISGLHPTQANSLTFSQTHSLLMVMSNGTSWRLTECGFVTRTS